MSQLFTILHVLVVCLHSQCCPAFMTMRSPLLIAADSMSQLSHIYVTDTVDDVTDSDTVGDVIFIQRQCCQHCHYWHAPMLTLTLQVYLPSAQCAQVPCVQCNIFINDIVYVHSLCDPSSSTDSFCHQLKRFCYQIRLCVLCNQCIRNIFCQRAI